jgi:phosphate transport system permease protein
MIFKDLKSWIDTGAPYIWLNAGAVSVSILLVVGLLMLIAVRGLSHFWPGEIAEFQLVEGDGSIITIIGEIVDSETVQRSRLPDSDNRIPEGLERVDRHLIKTGNRDYFGIDFSWVLELAMSGIEYPEELMAVERREWGNLYGYLVAIKDEGEIISSGFSDPWDRFQELIIETLEFRDEIEHIERDLIGDINYRMERLRLRERTMRQSNNVNESELAVLSQEEQQLQAEYDSYSSMLSELYGRLNRYSFITRIADGREVELPLAQAVRAYRPNAMGFAGDLAFYFEKIWEFVSDEPREANTEGGIYPAIFGTVMMVLIMAVLVTPFGVIAAVYLHEYAKQGPLVRTIRIAVNNLAGVPSVVYGVFGLGFFVYFIGGNIDQLFFAESLPSPTFGTPGLLWASLTLAILTVPVVIVSTEEGLSRVPRAIREGSLALGATKAETLIRTVLPMTASAMMTGLILAIARAAGEVAPLMLVGVVKLAPSLPLDGNFPYLHLERKFMHLGFHIYDVGFQSPNVEAARPLVYATALLLVLIIIILNLAAIQIRNKLREKYRATDQH